MDGLKRLSGAKEASQDGFAARGFFFFGDPTGTLQTPSLVLYYKVFMKVFCCLLFAASVTALARLPRNGVPALAVAPSSAADPQAEDGATLTGRVKIKGE